jgi:SPIRAL1-like protein
MRWRIPCVLRPAIRSNAFAAVEAIATICRMGVCLPARCRELAAEFNGEVAIGVPQAKAAIGADGPIGVNNNNYVRDQGQNVGNFITDRPSSRVLAPPGGVTSWSLGGDVLPPAPKPRPAAGPASHPVELTAVATAQAVPAAVAPSDEGAAAIDGEGGVGHNNNYSRPQGQNVG